jgi:hypothetical protein
MRWLFLLAFLLAGCKPSEVPPQSVQPVVGNVHLQRQQEMEKASMDFSRVVSVRLNSEGKRLEVTSIMPMILAEVRVKDVQAKTIFRVNDAGNKLQMFSLDSLNGSSIFTEVDFAELEMKKGVTFAVLDAEGRLQNRTFALEKIVAVK